MAVATNRFRSGTLTAITGASGSGKSTLINEVLYKALWKRLVDTRTLPGEHGGGDQPLPIWHVDSDRRRVRLGQEHADQRSPVQGALEAVGRHADAAGRAWRCRPTASDLAR